MSARTIKATTIAWVTSYQANDFSRAMHKGDHNEVINTIAFSSRESMGKGKDAWTRIGRAEITVEMEGEDKLISNTVKALRSQQQAVRAEAEKQAVDLERQIQQLLAITNEVKA